MKLDWAATILAASDQESESNSWIAVKDCTKHSAISAKVEH